MSAPHAPGRPAPGNRRRARFTRVPRGRPAPPSVSILVLTEDSGKHAHDTIAALCKKMLQLVEPACQTHRIDFEPANQQARQVVNANRWKSNKPHRELVTLRQTIATKIREETGFVFFHVDGDCAWSERDSSSTPTLFEKQITGPVRALLLTGATRREPVSQPEASRLLGRLRLVMPYYSIEAWLYQNIDVALALCRQHHRGEHVERFESWKDNRHEIDELVKPKETVCLRSEHNKELAEAGYPARVAYEVKTSFAAAVDLLRECEELCAALRASCS
jgi:hypothetical protein